MGRLIAKRVNGRKIAYLCLAQKRHGEQCHRLECECPCHDSEDVEDRSVTPERLLDRKEPAAQEEGG